MYTLLGNSQMCNLVFSFFQFFFSKFKVLYHHDHTVFVWQLQMNSWNCAQTNTLSVYPIAYSCLHHDQLTGPAGHGQKMNLVHGETSWRQTVTHSTCSSLLWFENLGSTLFMTWLYTTCTCRSMQYIQCKPFSARPDCKAK